MANTPSLKDLVLPGKLGSTAQPTNSVTYQQQGAPTSRELQIDLLRKGVERSLRNHSAVAHMMPQRMISGTSTVRIDAMGGGGLGVKRRGEAPELQNYKFGKSSFTIDTPVIARAAIEKIDEVSNHLPAIRMIAEEQGKDLALFLDQMYIIVATKAGMMTQTPFQGMAGVNGFSGGNQITMAAAADARDPAKLFNAFRQLRTQFRNKNVDWVRDGNVILVSNETLEVLLSNEMLTDRHIKWSDGTEVNGVVLRNFGIPVVATNQFIGGQNITNHLLSNAANNNFYNIDATKLVATVVSAKALQDGFFWKPQSTIKWDDVDLCTYATTWMACGAGVARPEYAGVIMTA